jgi:hypothetical protein
MNKNPGSMELFDQVTKYLVVAYQAIALLALIVVPFWAFKFFQQPFIGIFVEHTMVTNGVGPDIDAEDWPLYDERLRFGNQLISLSVLDASNNPVQTIQPKRFSEITALLKGHLPGENIEATFQDEQKQQTKYIVPLSVFPIADRLRFFVLPYFVGIGYLFVSLWIFGLRRSETAGRAFTILASSVAIVAGCLLDIYTTNYLTPLWIASVSLVAASLIHLGLVFPQEARIVLRYPFLRLAGYAAALVLTLVQFATLFNLENQLHFCWPRYFVFRWRDDLPALLLSVSGCTSPSVHNPNRDGSGVRLYHHLVIADIRIHHEFQSLPGIFATGDFPGNNGLYSTTLPSFTNRLFVGSWGAVCRVDVFGCSWLHLPSAWPQLDFRCDGWSRQPNFDWIGNIPGGSSAKPGAGVFAKNDRYHVLPW